MEAPEGKRPRCTACANLTRFDAKVVAETEEFHHYGIDGTLQVEEVVVVSKDIQLSCRWCGHGNNIEWVESNVVDQEAPSST